MMNKRKMFIHKQGRPKMTKKNPCECWPDERWQFSDNYVYMNINLAFIGYLSFEQWFFITVYKFTLHNLCLLYVYIFKTLLTRPRGDTFASYSLSSNLIDKKCDSPLSTFCNGDDIGF